MATSIGRRDALLAAGGVLAATTVAGCGSSYRDVSANGGRPGTAGNGGTPPPPLPRNTGTIASKTVPHTVWKYTAGDIPRGLRYAGGRTFVITLSSLTALDARHGRELWRIPLFSTDTKFGDAIADGVLYICGSTGPGADRLLAVDCATGHILWTFTAPPGIVLNGVSGPLRGTVYVVLYDGKVKQRQVWALDAATREVRWKSLCASQDDTDVYAPAGGTRVFNCDNSGAGMTAFDAASGKAVWQTRDFCCFGSQGPTGKTLIAYGSATVAGLDATSGVQAWQAAPSLSGPGTGLIAQAFTSDGKTYFVWDGANLRSYKAGSRGTEVWSAALKTSSPVLSLSVEFDDHGTMFIGAGYLFAVDTRTGGCRWQYPSSAGASAGSLLDMLDAPLAVGGGYCFTAADIPASNTITALATES